VFLAKAQVNHAFIIDFIATSLQIGLLGYCYYVGLKSFSFILFLLGLAYLPAIFVSLILYQFGKNSFSGYKPYISLQFHQAKWLVLTTITQWWASNLFIVTAGVYLGVKALGAFRLVQSLFGILNLILQTFENYVLPEASRRYIQSSESARFYLKGITKKSSIVFGIVLTLLFLFSEQVIQLAGGPSYESYAYIIKGMCILYVFIFIGYPIRLSIRMLVLNKLFFIGYVISFIISILSFDYLLKNWGISGAIVGLTLSQIVTLTYWQYVLLKKDFVLWK
jgi:O-antigen/teichoic acid export membrane protein